MNRQEKDILQVLNQNKHENQRSLSEKTGHSLGVVNRSVKQLIADGYIEEDLVLSGKGKELFNHNMPHNAIILAAGRGMRMIPINREISKGLLEVKKEILIERTIKQLHHVGIEEIYVVVGFMKEKYEYLIDEYGVELIVNTEYETRNNLHSLSLAADYLSNSYIIPCDLWCEKNPFSKNELYSWYMVSNEKEIHSMVRMNRKSQLVRCSEQEIGNRMIGICYLRQEESQEIRDRIRLYESQAKYHQSYWEEILFQGDKMIAEAKLCKASEIYEINTYEQLRDLDENSNQLQSEVLSIICKVLNINKKDIKEIELLKKGMTNRSFVFKCKDKKYIMRIPGEGTDKLINRKKEAAIYQSLSGEKISENILYMDPQKGYKLAEFFENARTCNPRSLEDIVKCMSKLRCLHEKKIECNYEFDLYKEIDFYESLWEDEESIYRDYEITKKNVLSLRKYIEENIEYKTLAHVDAIADNFLFIQENDTEEVRLIDWEYAGMQDPHIDLAMFSIYSFFDKVEIDNLIDIYFQGNCRKSIRLKIYAYVATCGLLWSNWCEYKRSLGIEFGEYSIKQYRYAKEYYKLFKEEEEKGNE